MNTPMNQKDKFIKEDGADKVDEAHFKSLIRCLMYLTSTRLDILFQFMHCSSELHLKAAKRVVRYIKGTANYGVKYDKVQDFKLSSFSDSDWAGSLDDMKSTSGYCFSMGSSVLSWCSKKQEVVAQSVAKAKFVAATVAINQAIWLRNIPSKFRTELFQSHMIACFTGRPNTLIEVQENGDVSLVYCKTKDQTAYMFMKSFSLNKFEFMRKKLGVCDLQDGNVTTRKKTLMIA
ncbi:putative mitochondrial protein, partial [Mucuna pruriens]